MNTNPIYGLLHTLWLFLIFRVRFYKDDVGREIVMKDGKVFRVFRHVQIRQPGAPAPQGAFIVRFRLNNMTIAHNIRFSLLPMMIFMGFTGFREKFWCVDDRTGLYLGVYFWQTVEDARRYSQSIAMRFMKRHS